MPVTPDIKYDEIVGYFELKDQELKGGIIYLEEAWGNGRYKFGDVLSFDCSDFDYTQHVGAANAYIKEKILTFPNGMYLNLHAYVKQTEDPLIGIWVNVLAYDKDDNQVVWAPVGNEFHLQWSNGAGCFPGVFKDFGFKIAFLTDYYSFHPNTPATEDITPPDYYRLQIFFANRLRDNTAQYYLNSMSGIVSEGLMSHKPDPTLPSWYTPSPGNVYINTINLIYDADLDAKLAEIKTAGGSYEGGYQLGYPNDPNQDVDPSNTGGGDGEYTGGAGGGDKGQSEYDKNSDPIDFPAVPTGGALSTGAIKGFVVNTSTISAMFNKLWDASAFDIDTLQKLLSEPLDAIISLHVLPFAPSVSADQFIHLGNYDFENTIYAPVVSSQYKIIDCGTLEVKKYWGSALDYSPYTKVEIYLPFIGIRELKAEDVIGFTLGIKYNVDVLTGDLTCSIKCGMSVLYKFQGNCKATIPLSEQVNTTLATIAKSAGIVASSAGGGVAGVALSAALNTAMSKVVVNRSGDLSGNAGLLDDFTPYLIIHRPIQSLAKDFRKFKGYPSNITAKLGDLKGYTEVDFINLQNIPNATSAEMAEIKNLLMQGVLL